MNIRELFTTPLFMEELNLDTKSIEKYCLSHRDKNDGRIVSNVSGGYQSKDTECISILVEEINKYLNIFSESLEVDTELYVGNMWININEFKDYNILHFHPNALFSGVYYVRTPEKCGNIIFENPAHDLMHNDITYKKWNSYNSIEHWQEARENILYVFPGWLKHRVGPNLSGEKRISISFNIII